MNNNDFLQDYMFHYNIYTHEWNAFLRDDVNNYWNGVNKENIIKAQNINHVVDLLCIRHGIIK